VEEGFAFSWRFRGVFALQNVKVDFSSALNQRFRQQQMALFDLLFPA
jgi:hypothetical protein